MRILILKKFTCLFVCMKTHSTRLSSDTLFVIICIRLWMSPPLCLHTTVASLSSLDGKLMTRSSRDRHMLVLHGQRRSPMAQTHVISYPPIICSWLLFSPVSRPRDWCGWLGRAGLRFAKEKAEGKSCWRSRWCNLHLKECSRGWVMRLMSCNKGNSRLDQEIKRRLVLAKSELAGGTTCSKIISHKSSQIQKACTLSNFLSPAIGTA